MIFGFFLFTLNWGIFFTVVLGAVSGYVASRILGGDGYGFLGNIVIGILGGLLGTWLVDLLHIPMPSGWLGRFISSVGGAILLIFLLEIIRFIQRVNKKPVQRRRTRR